MATRRTPPFNVLTDQSNQQAERELEEAQAKRKGDIVTLITTTTRIFRVYVEPSMNRGSFPASLPWNDPNFTGFIDTLPYKLAQLGWTVDDLIRELPSPFNTSLTKDGLFPSGKDKPSGLESTIGINNPDQILAAANERKQQEKVKAMRDAAAAATKPMNEEDEINAALDIAGRQSKHFFDILGNNFRSIVGAGAGAVGDTVKTVVGDAGKAIGDGLGGLGKGLGIDFNMIAIAGIGILAVVLLR